MLKLLLMGISTKHAIDEIISRQEANGPYVMIQCLNNCVLGTRNGLVNAQCGDMIIWRQGAHRFIGPQAGGDAGFCNNWLFLHSDDMQDALSQYCVPDNVLISNSSHNKAVEIFSDLQYEYTLNLANRDDKIDMLIRMLLIQMGRQANARTGVPSANVNFEYLAKFRQMRADIYAYPAREISVSELASQLNMSPGRFSQLYSMFFSIPPKHDIIQARLSLARALLVLENEPLHSVARMSGFQNEYYFSRIFKKYIGCTPGAYRQKGGMI